jgi:hypothetical protein
MQPIFAEVDHEINKSAVLEYSQIAPDSRVPEALNLFANLIQRADLNALSFVATSSCTSATYHST